MDIRKTSLLPLISTEQTLFWCSQDITFRCLVKDKFGQIAIQNLPENSHLMSHVLSNFGKHCLPIAPFWSTNLALGHLPLISIAS